MALLSSSSFWINTCKQLLHLLAELLLWYSNPSCVLRTPLDERMKWEYLLPDLENKAPSKEEEVRWRGLKRKRWFNFHCHTKIFKAIAGGNRKPLRRGGGGERKMKKASLQHFYNPFHQSTEGCRRKEDWAALPLFFLSLRFNFASNCRRVGSKPFSAFTCDMSSTARPRGRAVNFMPPRCFQSGFFSSISLYPFFLHFFPSCCQWWSAWHSARKFCLFVVVVFRQNTNKYKHLGWDVCLCVCSTY